MSQRNSRVTGLPIDAEAQEQDLTAFADGLKMGAAKQNTVYTENGALVYASTSDARTDFMARASEFRNSSAAKVAEAFDEAYKEDAVDAVTLAFQLGDIREGKGERSAFKTCLDRIGTAHPAIMAELLPLIPEYSRWDYAAELIMSKNPSTAARATKLVVDQLHKDIADCNAGAPGISLLAKWLPSVQSKKPEKRQLAHRLMKALKMDFKEYRKTLGMLRDKLNIIEKFMSQNEFQKIDQEALTSKQQLLLDPTLMKHIPGIRMAYLQDVNDGNAKMNTGVLTPHEVLYKYRSLNCHKNSYQNRITKVSPAMETIWKQLPDKVNGKGNILVIRDGSGSMERQINNKTNCTCLDVATALSIYCAERLSGPLKDKFITFSSSPKFVDLSRYDTLMDKYNECLAHTECSNTDFMKTADMILDIAVDNHLTQDQLPGYLLILSDMEFDTAMNRSFRSEDDHDYSYHSYRCLPDKDTLFDTIKTKWKAAGYELPTLVFWHLNAERTIFPEIDSKNGIINLSGFSTNTLDMVMEGRFELIEQMTQENGEVTTEKRVMTPYEQMRTIIDGERYAPVREAAQRGLEHEAQGKDWFKSVVERSMQDEVSEAGTGSEDPRGEDDDPEL